ncbi:tRNA epoxyqueuosine(34) reductase QueG [bacterium]|nr:tRNA epoxyqueuosine(34) reductase QueG [bacterium]
MHPRDLQQLVKESARKTGFDACGISTARFLEEEAPLLEKWLSANMHGEMQYMANHFDKRLDPRQLFPGCKSVISLVANYYPQKEQPAGLPKISRYAYGRDYHKVLKKMCKELIETLQKQIGDFAGRAFVDSAPVMDKAWAKNSGLGWMGKHSNLINRNIGSYFFIAEILCDLDIEPDAPIKDYCGSCTKCIDVCPTDAIAAPYLVDGSKCISYLTIELKNAIPETFKDKYSDWVFGCDICQEVCPWNRFAKPHTKEDWSYHADKLEMDWKDWEEITEELFEKRFAGSPLKRAKLNGIKRNVAFVNPSDNK